MAIISGEVVSSGKIYVINSATDTLERVTDVVEGEYSIDLLTNGVKSLMFVRNDGKAEAYGGVSAIVQLMNGVMYACGQNAYGVLGFGHQNNVLEPSIVGTTLDWDNIDCGSWHTMAIKNNGTLWGCGYNASFQLGTGNNTNFSTFTQIGSDTDWKSVACGNYHTLALKTNGTLWSCGLNDFGQLGHGDLTNRNVFTQLGDATDWTIVSCGDNYTFCKK